MAGSSDDWNIRSKSLQAAFLYMFEKKINCDVRITFKNQSLDAHKFMITSRTAAFRDALSDLEDQSQHSIPKQKEGENNFSETSLAAKNKQSISEENEEKVTKIDESALRTRELAAGENFTNGSQSQVYIGGHKAGGKEVKEDDHDFVDTGKEEESSESGTDICSGTDSDTWSDAETDIWSDAEIWSGTNDDSGSETAFDKPRDTERDKEKYKEEHVQRYRSEEAKDRIEYNTSDEMTKGIRNEVREESYDVRNEVRGADNYDVRNEVKGKVRKEDGDKLENEIKVDDSINSRWNPETKIGDELKFDVPSDNNAPRTNEGQVDEMKCKLIEYLEDEGNGQIEEKVEFSGEDKLKHTLKHEVKPEYKHETLSRILGEARNVGVIDEKEGTQEFKVNERALTTYKVVDQPDLRKQIGSRNQKSEQILNENGEQHVVDGKENTTELEEIKNKNFQHKTKRQKKKLETKSPCFTVSKTSEGVISINIGQEGLEECSFDNLKTFIGYLYSETAEVDLGSALQLISLGQLFFVPSLVHECTAILYRHCLTIENVCGILSQSLSLGVPILTQRCLKFIARRAKLVLQSSEFLRSHEKVVLAILSTPNLMLTEVELFVYYVEWGRAQCRYDGMVIDEVTLREKLSSVLPLIRFPLMSPDEFIFRVMQLNILTTAEQLDVYKSLTVPDYVPNIFSSQTRVLRKARVIRFDTGFTKLPASCSHPEKLKFLEFACRIESRSIPILRALHFILPQGNLYQLMYANFEIRDSSHVKIYGERVNCRKSDFSDKMKKLFIIEKDVALDNGTICDMWKLQLHRKDSAHREAITVGTISVLYSLMFSAVAPELDLDQEASVEFENPDGLQDEYGTCCALSDLPPVVRYGRIHGRSVKLRMRGRPQPLCAIELYYK